MLGGTTKRSIEAVMLFSGTGDDDVTGGAYGGDLPSGCDMLDREAACIRAAPLPVHAVTAPALVLPNVRTSGRL
jgi:hypothetical protein